MGALGEVSQEKMSQFPLKTLKIETKKHPNSGHISGEFLFADELSLRDVNLFLMLL